jgi:hypothetical protein
LPFAITGTIIAPERPGQQATGIERKAVVRENDVMGSFVLGGVMGVLALLGLFVAAGAQDGVFYGTGLGLFVFCVLFIFVMIHRQVGR